MPGVCWVHRQLRGGNVRDLSRQWWPHSRPETIDTFSMFPFVVRINILVPRGS